MNVLEFLVLCDNKFYRYFYVYFFCQFASPYYLRLSIFVSYTHLWNHCKYMIVYLIPFLNIYVCLFCRTHKIKCASNQQTTSSKVLKIPFQWIICRRRIFQSTIMTLKETSWGIYFLPSSNNIPSSPPSRVISKIKSST